MTLASEMALYKRGQFCSDAWQFPTVEESTLPTGDVALPRARLLAEWPDLQGRSGGLGVILQSGEKLEGLEAILPRLRLIALHIPKYSDGRQYSIARRLRDNFGYRHELRATGDVLQDQVALLLRAGFDALQISHAGTISRLREGLLVAVSRHYQPASAEAAEAKPGGRPWLRISPAAHL
jgi:uncharacterized protein (DUF934 family)